MNCDLSFYLGLVGSRLCCLFKFRDDQAGGACFPRLALESLSPSSTLLLQFLPPPNPSSLLSLNIPTSFPDAFKLHVLAPTTFLPALFHG